MNDIVRETMSNDDNEYIRQQRRRTARWKTVGSVFSVIGVLLVAGILIFVQCNGCQASDDRALEAIKGAGLSDAKLGGADVMACQGHESSRHFEALNPQGVRVEGTVCCGLTGIGKGCTIRWGR